MGDKMLVLILNGPPDSGKDHGAEYLRYNYGFVALEMKAPLRELAHRISGAPSLCRELEFDKSRKSTEKRPEFGDRTWREYLIWLSEHVCKPLFGEDVFTRVAVDAVQRARRAGFKHVVFSDGGFEVEVRALVEAFGAEVLVAQIERPGCGFAGDSRGYVDPPRPAGLWRLENDGDVRDYERALDALMLEVGCV